VCEHNSATRLCYRLGSEVGVDAKDRKGDDIARVNLRKRWRKVKTRIFSAQTAEKIRHPASFSRA